MDGRINLYSERLKMKTEKVNQFEVQYMTIKEFNALRNAGKINSDTAYQRGLTAKWLTPLYRGSWLDSILTGKSIGVIMVNLTSDGTYELIDGKQRQHAITLTLDGLGTFEGVPDFDVNKTFENWNEVDREAFLNYQLTFIVYRGLDEEACREIFERTNGGIALGSFELRRGKLVKIISHPLFNPMVGVIHGLMVKNSKRVTRSNAEEVLLQSLSTIALSNHDYTAKMYVEKLQTLPVSDYESNFNVLQTAVDNLVELVDEENEDNFTALKWVLRKSILSCLLTLNVKEFNPLNFTSFPKRATDKAAGDDQIEFKKYNSNATASEVNVKGRIAILEKIQTGHFTKNVAGDPKPEKVVTPKTQKIDLAPVEITKKQRLEAMVVWRTDDVDYINTTVGMAIAWCNAYGFKYDRPYQTQKSLKNQYCYFDREGKNHANDVSNLSSTVTVKIAPEETPAVEVEPVTVE